MKPLITQPAAKKTLLWYFKSAYVVWLRPLDFTKQDQIAFVIINTLVVNLIIVLLAIPEATISGTPFWIPVAFGMATATPVCAIMMTLGANSMRDILKLRTEMENVSTRLAEQNAELEATRMQLARLANFDGLTGLANRRSFSSALERAFRKYRDGDAKGDVWLAMLDLDSFKRINDTYGHDAGDEVLITVAERMIKVFQHSDTTVARFGGDEFAIIMHEPDAQPDKTVEARARSLCAHLAGGHIYKGNPLTLGASIGLAKLDKSFETSNAFLKAADMALFSAKATGKGRVCIHGEKKTSRLGLSLKMKTGT